MTMFYIGCHRPTTTLLFYPGLAQAVNGALAELFLFSLEELQMGPIAGTGSSGPLSSHSVEGFRYSVKPASRGSLLFKRGVALS